MLVAPSGARPHRIPRPPLVPSKIDHALDLVVVGAPNGLHDARAAATMAVARRNVGFDALASLDLSSCESLSGLDPLSGLTALTSLDLSWCDTLSDLGPLKGLTALASLDLVVFLALP